MTVYGKTFATFRNVLYEMFPWLFSENPIEEGKMRCCAAIGLAEAGVNIRMRFLMMNRHR